VHVGAWRDPTAQRIRAAMMKVSKLFPLTAKSWRRCRLPARSPCHGRLWLGSSRTWPVSGIGGICVTVGPRCCRWPWSTCQPAVVPERRSGGGRNATYLTVLQAPLAR